MSNVHNANHPNNANHSKKSAAPPVAATPPPVPTPVIKQLGGALEGLKKQEVKEKKNMTQNGGRHTAAHRQAVRRMKKAMTKMNMALKKCNKKRMTRRRKH